MEFVYACVCVIDVHKSFIVTVIYISESIKPRYIKKDFRILRELTRYKFKLTNVHPYRRTDIETTLLSKTAN